VNAIDVDFQIVHGDVTRVYEAYVNAIYVDFQIVHGDVTRVYALYVNLNLR